MRYAPWLLASQARFALMLACIFARSDRCRSPVRLRAQFLRTELLPYQRRRTWAGALAWIGGLLQQARHSQLPIRRKGAQKKGWS